MINPGEAVEKIIKNEILNQSHLIDRLCGERAFPIELKLKLADGLFLLGDPPFPVALVLFGPLLLFL